MDAGCGCAGWIGDSRGVTRRGVTRHGVARRGGCVSWDTGWPGCSPLAVGGQGGCAPTLLSLASDLCFTLSLQTPSVWQQQFNARLIVAGPRCAGRQWGPPRPRHARLVTAVRAPASPGDAAQLLQGSSNLAVPVQGECEAALGAAPHPSVSAPLAVQNKEAGERAWGSWVTQGEHL